jgi:preprotein translocase subunit SecD
VAPPSRSVPRPWRALTALIVIVLIMLIAITGKDTFSPGNWHKDFRVGLGLDLSSGTQVTLKATTFSGGTPSAAEMNTAQTIMLNRVNGTGNSGAQVEPEGNDLLTISVPNANSQQVIKLVSTTADLWFRPVLLEQPYTGTSTTTPKATPTPSSSSTPKASTSPKASDSASPKATSTAKTTAKITHDDASASPSSSASPKASTSATPKPSATPSASSSSSSTYYGDQSEVSKSVLAQFEKTKCTPSSSSETVDSSWKNGINYTYRQYDDQTAQVISCDSSGAKYVLGPAVVKGEDVSSANAELDTSGSEWVVAISLDGKASSAWGTLTTKLYQDYEDYQSNQSDYNDYVLSQTAVVLDGNAVSVAYTEAALTDGSFQIQGNFSESYATFLANVIKYGSVPLNFAVVDSESVSPQIGSDSLDAALIAAAIGFILVIAYCVGYYRGLALVSISSLLMATLLAFLSIILLTKYQSGFGLELSSIAGLIVAVGITADSFVVFFERLRDEVREGKSLRPAVESGWRRARRTILVSDTVSFLAALVLYELAIGDVRGFAYMLGLTTIIDVIVVFLFTHPLVTLLAQTKFFGGGHRWSGLSPDRLGARSPWRSSIRRQPAGRASRTAGTREA